VVIDLRHRRVRSAELRAALPEGDKFERELALKIRSGYIKRHADDLSQLLGEFTSSPLLLRLIKKFLDAESKDIVELNTLIRLRNQYLKEDIIV